VDQLSARATPESYRPAADIVQHLQGPLLHVANDPRGGVVIIGREGEAAVLQDARGVELHGGAPIEDEGDPRQLDAADAGEVEARVEYAEGAREPVHVHLGPERRPQRAVRSRRQPGDDGARVHDGARREHGGGHVEPPSGHGDGLQDHDVEGGDFSESAHGRHGKPRGRDARHAEREEPGVARRPGEAVGEDSSTDLRHQRLHAAANPEDPVCPVRVGEARLGVAAAEREAAADHAAGAGGGHREGVGAVRAGGAGAVSVVDGVAALTASGAATGVLSTEPRAGRGGARDGGEGGRLARVEDGVLLSVARWHGARTALDPGEVGARVNEHGLVDGRRA